MASRDPMTLTEAAALLGVTAATLRQQVANGRLRARRVGPLWTVTPKEVERYRLTSRARPGRPRKA
jgi:excisionase family DNA binding protein